MTKTILSVSLYQIKKGLVFFLIYNFFIPNAGWAKSINFQFREQYEVNDIRFRGVDSQFRGFSNTFGVGFEEPFDFAYSIVAGSVGNLATTDEAVGMGLSQSLEFFFAGIELRYFPYESWKGFFTRIGGYWNQINTKTSVGRLDGWSYYSGLGWEILLSDHIGLAPEIGIRQGDSQGLFFTTYRFSLGLHLYKF